MDKSLATTEILSTTALTDLIIDTIQDMKGHKIVKMDLRKLDESPSDFFVVCEGSSITQVKAIADNIERRVKEETGMRPSHAEGKTGSTWVLVDYFDVVVHVFHPETRKYYEIEDLWSDAQTTEYQDI